MIGRCFKQHRAKEFLTFLREIDANVPDDLDVHLVMDDYATHKTPAIRKWLAKRPHWPEIWGMSISPRPASHG